MGMETDALMESLVTGIIAQCLYWSENFIDTRDSQQKAR